MFTTEPNVEQFEELGNSLVLGTSETDPLLTFTGNGGVGENLPTLTLEEVPLELTSETEIGFNILPLNSSSDLEEETGDNDLLTGNLVVGEFDDLTSARTRQLSADSGDINLTGLSFNVVKEQLHFGEEFDLEFVVQNTEATDTGEFDVAFYLSTDEIFDSEDYYFGNYTIESLAGNSTTDLLTTSLVLPDGTDAFWNGEGDYYIGLVVDIANAIAETDELDNVTTAESVDAELIEITEMGSEEPSDPSDVNVSGLYFNVVQEPLNFGDSFDLEFVIQNTESGEASDVEVDFYLSVDEAIDSSDYSFGSYTVESLAGNSNTDLLTANVTLPEAGNAIWNGEGYYYLGMLVDVNNTISETDEGDNVNVGELIDWDGVEIEDPNKVDLYGLAFNVVQEPLKTGDSFEVEFQVQNAEMGDAGEFEVSFYLSADEVVGGGDRLLGSQTINGLVGDSNTDLLTASLTLPGVEDAIWENGESYHIGMIVDSGNAVSESNEGNNANLEEYVDSDSLQIYQHQQEEPIDIDPPVRYDFPVENQPLVGIIDTGFAAENPDIDYNRVTLGRDRLDGDDNPLLTATGNEHGTHILGIVGATQDNGLGIDGVNDDAPLWIGRAIGSGDWADSLVEFVDYARSSGQPNALVNLSFDLTEVDSNGDVKTRYELTPEEREALEYARQNGVLIVVAAGNDGDVMSVLGQASQEFDNIITVGAADGLNRAVYSSYGNGLDVLAEGGTVDNPVLSLVGDGVGTMAGTSVAAAKVAGAASLVWAANPDLSYRQVIETITSTTRDLQASGWDEQTGSGLLQVEDAVVAAENTAGEVYDPQAWVAPETWRGEGLVTPLERAVAGGDSIITATVQSSPNFSDLDRVDASEPDKYYQFTLEESGYLSWTLRGQNSERTNSFPDINVIKADGSLGDYQFLPEPPSGGVTIIGEIIGGQYSTTDNAFFEPGTYYLKVSNNLNSPINDYQISTEFAADRPSNFSGDAQFIIPAEKNGLNTDVFSGITRTQLDVSDTLLSDIGQQDKRIASYGIEVNETGTLTMDVQSAKGIYLAVNKYIGSKDGGIPIGSYSIIDTSGDPIELNLNRGRYEIFVVPPIDAMDRTEWFSFALNASFNPEPDIPQPGEGNIPGNAGDFVETVVSNGVTTHYYAKGYLTIQPNGHETWYESGPISFTQIAVQIIEPTFVAPDVRDINFDDGYFTGRHQFPGSVSSSDRYDYYRFNLAPLSDINRHYLRFILRDNNGIDIPQNGLNMKLLDQNLNEVSLSETWRPGIGPAGAYIDGETYYVAVEKTDSGTTNYNLVMHLDSALQERSHARRLGKFSGRHAFEDFIGIGDSDDYYHFEVDDPSFLRFSLRGGEGDVDLLDSNGTLLTSADNNDNGNSPLDEGSYYLRVKPVGDINTNYRLTLQMAEDFGEFTGRKEYKNRYLGFSYPEDFYRFSLDESGNLHLALNDLSADVNMQLYRDNGGGIYDATPISSPGYSDRNGRQWEYKRYDDLPAGDYFLEVKLAPGEQGANYSLVVNSDRVGNSTETALDLGNLSGRREVQTDFVGVTKADPVDFYKFTTGSRRDRLYMALRDLEDDANVFLLDGNKNEIASSTKGGTEDEFVSYNLERNSTYYVKVEPANNSANTNYTLDLDLEEAIAYSGGNNTPLLTQQGVDYFQDRPEFYTTGNEFHNSGWGSKLLGGGWNRKNNLGQGTEGNCTWYAHGRVKELGGDPAALNSMLGDANKWHTQLSNGARILGSNESLQVGDIAQWTRPYIDDDGKEKQMMHVAVVEAVHSDGKITVSESHHKTNYDDGGIGTLHRIKVYTADNPDRYIRVPGVSVHQNSSNPSEIVLELPRTGGGDPNSDLINGTSEGENLHGGPGDDTLKGEDGNDHLYGDDDNDWLWGGNNEDNLHGGPGNDTLIGDEGNDTLFGDQDSDRLWGSNGNDILLGYGGSNNERDILTGDAGADKFILGTSNEVYYIRNGASDFATITDFNPGEDIIRLKGDASDYNLVPSGSNTEIYYGGENIALLEGHLGLNLTDSYFNYALKGNIDAHDRSYDVRFWQYGSNGVIQENDINIDNSKDTVIVIHGRTDEDSSKDGGASPGLPGDAMHALAMTLAEKTPDAQVLALDWREAARDKGQPPYDAAGRIQPVAIWAAKELKNLGIDDPNKISIVGHSLGTYVAAEMGKELNNVENLVALDPAFPGKPSLPRVGPIRPYDINLSKDGKQNVAPFDNTAQKSLAFVVSGSHEANAAAGDGEQAETAHDSILIEFDTLINLNVVDQNSVLHNGVTWVFIDITRQGLLGSDWREFQLPNHVDNSYHHNGVVVNLGSHEGMITAEEANYVEWNGDQTEWRVSKLTTVVGKHTVSGVETPFFKTEDYWTS